MSQQQVNANLQATIEVITDFDQARQDIDDMTEMIILTTDLWKELLNEGLAITPRLSEQAAPFTPEFFGEDKPLTPMTTPSVPTQVEQNLTPIEMVQQIQQEYPQTPFTVDPSLGGLGIRGPQGRAASLQQVEREYEQRVPETVRTATTAQRGELNIDMKVEVKGGADAPRGIVQKLEDELDESRPFGRKLIGMIRSMLNRDEGID